MFTLGQWKNFAELEESLSLDELYEVAGQMFELEDRRRKFAASLKGIDLEEEQAKAQGLPTFEDMKQKAAGIIAGIEVETEGRPKTEEQELRGIGIVQEKE